jgi:aryl-alcohol dehydrogenase-like predicted oxidoreductase
VSRGSAGSWANAIDASALAADDGRLGLAIAPIPGAKRVRWLEQNVAAVDLELTDEDLAVLAVLAVLAGQVTGARY